MSFKKTLIFVFLFLLAATIYGKSGDTSAVPVLIKALKDNDWYVREKAAYALEKIRDKSAVPALIEALRDESQGVRYYAAEALSKIGKSAVPGLIKALNDGDMSVRCIAADTLGSIGDTSALEPLAYIAENDVEENARNAAKYAISGIKSKSIAK
jgi:HEAT repeat protein